MRVSSDPETSVEFRHQDQVLVFDLLIPAQAVSNRIDQLASYIEPLLAQGADKIVAMPIQEGGDKFTHAVIDRLTNKPQIMPVKATRYSGTSAVAELTVDQDISDASLVKGKGVIIFDEIFETGTVAAWAYKRSLDCGAAWAIIVTLVDKPEAHKAIVDGKQLEPDLVGFAVKPSSAFLIGYGMDWHGQGRDLPWIGRVRDGSEAHYTTPELKPIHFN